MTLLAAAASCSTAITSDHSPKASPIVDSTSCHRIYVRCAYYSRLGRSYHPTLGICRHVILGLLRTLGSAGLTSP